MNNNDWMFFLISLDNLDQTIYLINNKKNYKYYDHYTL